MPWLQAHARDMDQEPSPVRSVISAKNVAYSSHSSEGLSVCGRQRLLGQAFDGVTFAVAALRASASSAAVKIVTDSPIKIAPKTRAAVSESPSQKTALARPKTGIRFTIMLAGPARTRAMA